MNIAVKHSACGREVNKNTYNTYPIGNSRLFIWQIVNNGNFHSIYLS